MSIRIWIGDECTHAEYRLCGEKLTQTQDYGCVGDILTDGGAYIEESMPDTAIRREVVEAWMDCVDRECADDPQYRHELLIEIERADLPAQEI